MRPHWTWLCGRRNDTRNKLYGNACNHLAPEDKQPLSLLDITDFFRLPFFPSVYVYLCPLSNIHAEEQKLCMRLI